MKTLTVLSILVINLAANSLCYEYDTSSIKAYKQNSKTSIEPNKFILKIPQNITEDNSQIKAYVDIKGKIYIYNWLLCSKKYNGIYPCGGECDSGDFTLDDKRNMKLTFIDFREDGQEEEISVLYIEGDKNRTLKAKEVPCPKFKATKKINKDKKGALYVCYSKREGSKSKPLYFGCVRSYNACKDINKKHFGHYLNEKDTIDALKRCVESKPKFVD